VLAGTVQASQGLLYSTWKAKSHHPVGQKKKYCDDRWCFPRHGDDECLYARDPDGRRGDGDQRLCFHHRDGLRGVRKIEQLHDHAEWNYAQRSLRP